MHCFKSFNRFTKCAEHLYTTFYLNLAKKYQDHKGIFAKYYFKNFDITLLLNLPTQYSPKSSCTHNT